MTRKNKREDVLASLDAALAGKAPSPLAGGKMEVLAEKAAPAVAPQASSSSPTLTADLTALAATTASPAEEPKPVAPVAVVPTPARVSRPPPPPPPRAAAAKPTLVSESVAPPVVPEPKTGEADKAEKRAAVAKIVEDAVAKRLQPLVEEIEKLRGQLGNVTKMLMGNIGMENMPGVLEAIEQNGGVLENLDAAQTQAKEAQTAAGVAKAKADELEGRFGELDGRVVSLDQEVATLSSKVDDLQVADKASKEDIALLDGKVVKAGKAVSALESGLAQLKTLVLGGIPEEMVEKLLEIVGTKGGLYVQVDNFQDKVSEVDSKTTQMDGSIADIEKRVGGLGKKVGALGSSVSDLSSDVGGLRTKIESVDKLAQRANGKADSAVDLSGDVTRLSGEVLNFDKKIEALDQRVQAEGQDHVSILQHEIIGILLLDNPATEVAEFIKVKDPDRVKAALLGLKGSPKLVRNLTVDMTKVREANGLTNEQLANPGDDVIAKKASAYIEGKVAQVATRVDYILTNWEKI